MGNETAHEQPSELKPAVAHDIVRSVSASWNFAVVICKNKAGKYLAVNETRNRGWWVPAGFVDPGESFFEGGIRETAEEAGVDVEIKGILRVEKGLSRMRVIFYAEPIDENQAPKSVPDSESLEGRYVTVEEFKKFSVGMNDNGYKIRGPELIEWGEYIDNGGIIYPLSLFTAFFTPAKLENVSKIRNCGNHTNNR